MTRWRNPVSGPDWTDIVMLMASLESLHKCQLTLVMSRDGMHDGPASRVVALAISNSPVDGLDQAQLSVTNVWPNKLHGTLTGMIYDLLMRLDNQILQKWWKQTDLA